MADPVATTPAARICEMTDLRTAALRLPRATPETLAACGAALGAALPLEPNRASGREPRVFWMAPGEWAVVGGADAQAPAEALSAIDLGPLGHLADLHAAWTAFQIAGEGAADLIAKGCSIDLHPRVFKANHCARTLLAQAAVLIERPPFSVDSYMVYVDRSLAAHLRAWLCRAAL